jgi:hypothetical protein
MVAKGKFNNEMCQIERDISRRSITTNLAIHFLQLLPTLRETI